MRISGEPRKPRPPLPEGGAHKGGAGGSVKASPFLDVLRAATETAPASAQESMAEQLRDVDAAAARLRSAPTMENLRRYKAAVRELLHDALRRMYAVRTEIGLERGGRRKLLFIVKKIDAELEELTRAVVERHGASLDLAARLDEIRGLLLDLYR